MAVKRQISAFPPGFWDEFRDKKLGPKTICRLAYQKSLRLRFRGEEEKQKGSL